MKTKRILATALCILMLLQMLPTFADSVTDAAKEETIEEKPVTGFGVERLLKDVTKPLFYEDLNDFSMARGTSDAFNGRINCSVLPANDNDEYGSYANVSTSSIARLNRFIDKPLTSGKYLLSFDIKKKQEGGLVYLNVVGCGNASTNNSADLSQTFALKNSDYGYYPNSTGWTHNAGGVKCVPDKWSHIMIWFDLDNDKVMYYADNVFMGETEFVKDIYSFRFHCEMHSSANVLSFDNLAFYESSYELVKILNDNGIAVPEDYRSPVNMSIYTKYSGNLFTEFNDVNINVDYENLNDFDVKYTAEYSVANYCGDIVWSDSEVVSLAAGESVASVLKPIVDKYDIYTLNVRVIPEDTSFIERQKSVQFSVVSAAKNGFTSDYFGTATHIAKGVTKWDKLDRIMDLSGMGWIRDECTWNTYEYKKGEYGMAPIVEEYIRDAKKMGINIILLWGPYNTNYGVTYNNVPKKTEDLEAMQRAAEDFAKRYGDIVDAVEFGNEQNFARQDALSCAEYARALQYFYNGIKKYAPEMKVLAADTSRADGEWIVKMLQEGGKGYCDVITIHPYQEAGSPETKMFTEHIYKEVRSKLEEIGCGDLEIWATESNSSSSFEYNTEQQHGFNFTRQIMQCIANNAMEKILIYQIQTPDVNIRNNEDCFGILRGAGVENAYGPKSAYMQMTAMANQLSDATYKDQLCQDNIYTFRFDKADGGHMIMMYADRDVVPVAINTGAAKGTLYDMNGNPTECVSDNGKFNFVLTDAPMYFVYKGDKYELSENKYFAEEALLRIPDGCTKTIELRIPKNAKVSINTREEYLDTKLVRDGDKAKLSVTVKSIPELTEYSERRQNFGTQIYRDYVNISVEDGKAKENLPIAVEYLKLPANMTASLLPYDNTNYNYWKLKLNIANVTEDKTLKGTLKLTSIEGVKEQKVEGIKPGKSASYSFNIPKSYIKGSNEYKGIFVTDEGLEIPFRVGDVTESYGYRINGKKLNIKYLKKSKEPVTIDGIINEKEWKNYLITNFDKSQVSYGSTNTVIAGVVEQATFGEDADYGGKMDFSGAIFSQWDDKYLYLAAQVNDDVHYAKEPTIRTYLDDFFYIDVCPTTTQRHDTRLEMSLSSFFDDNKGRLFRNWSQMFDRPIGGVIDESEDGVQVEVIRKENTTIYECRIPWSEVVDNETFELKNFSLNFGIRDYDGDRDKTFGYSGWFCLVDTIE